MSCVNTSSKEFKSLLSKVNVSSGTLELLIHKLQNDNENAPYPTPSEVVAKLSPKAFTGNADIIHTWANNYSKPRYFRTIDEAEFFFMEDATKIFGKDSVSLTQTKDGGYIAEVGRPNILPFNLNNGIWSELKSTLKEGPKDALLKSFIEVFEINGRLPIVDISSLPNTEYISANGIKTNGVPLALGGRDYITFDTNTLLSLMSKTSPNMREKVFKQYFLHELTHSVTLAAIDKVEAGKGTKEEKAFYDEINRIYNIAKEAMGAKADSYYGMNNIKEFLAEITSNLSFQKRLASIKDTNIKATKEKNLWNAIIDAFTSFFNKYFNMNIEGSILESGLKSLSEYTQYAKNNSTSIEATPTELARKINSVTPETFLTFNSLSDLQRFLQNEGFTVGVGNSNKTEAEVYIMGKHKYNGAYWLKQWTDESLTSNINIAKNLLNKVLSNLGIADKGVVTIKDTSKGTIVEFHKEAFDKAKKDILESVQDRDYYENSLLSESEQYDLEVLDSVDSELSSLVKEGKLSIYEAKDLFEQKNGISIYYQSNPDMAFSQAPSDTLNFKPEEAEFYSGAAIGSDKAWEEAATKAGIKVKNYTATNWDKLSNEERERLDKEYQEVVNILGRKVLDINSYSGKLVRRDMLQADKADAIFAIGTVASNGYVDGGTGYATTRGILRGIPVYLFDQSDSTWKVWDKEQSKFVPTIQPSLTKNAAVVGTRKLQDNGKEAINSIFTTKPQQEQKVEEPTEKTIEDTQEETPQINKTEKEQDLYTTKQQDKMQQIDNLLGDNLLSATEIRHIAEQAVYWISDHITELQENPELAKTIYGDRFKNEDGTDKDFASMTRADVVRTIGVDNIVEMCKQKFSPEHNDFDNDDTLDKAFAITDNWQAIMLLAQDSFLNSENFSIVSTPDGKANEVNEDLVGDADNFNESNDQSDVEEIEGSLQEHWQIESRCQDVLGTMSQMVRRALLKCYILDKDGNNVQSEFGINERINVREATNSILRWTQGSLSLADMITKLQEKQEDNPWVKQLINRLSDTSGKETDFQGQFYGTFSKHFQPYSVVIEEDGKYKSIQVNENPALSEAMTQITTQYKIGEHPLFTTDGINKESFKELRAAYDSLEKFRHMGYDLSNEVNKDEAANTLGYISNLFGYYVTPDMVKNNLTKENYKKMYSALGYIIKSFENNLDNASYEPFKFKSKDSINGNMREFLKPITEQLEDIAVSAFYDSGKMYQSYVTPSYMSKLMQKFSQNGEAFDKFLTEEFGNQPWFHEGTDIERGWRNSWLRALATDSKAKEIFKHKVQLNFNKHNYMRDMSDMEYALSLFTEYFSEGANDKQSKVPAWFRVPMLSNKPSSEFIRFYSERGTNYKETITDGMMDIFNQELSRIQTVLMRNLDSKDPRFIKNFDKNGKKFCFLDFMNDYLTGDKKNSELGKLINDKVNGKEVDEAKLYELANKAIFDTMDARAKAIVEKWIDSGLMEGAKKITGIGVTEEEIKSNLENFVWNDTFAAMNIMELTVTDIAYYKNAEDLQKRLAQIHAPGIRGNVDATDYEGRKVSDGKERTFYLTDWDDFVSNIIDNVSIVFDRKIAEAPEAEKAGYRALKESLVGENGAFRNINVADAQGYSSPTSYRKKAFIFGKWSKKAEDIYQKLRKGEYNYNDLSVAFQPLKPFVYSQIEKSSGVANAPLDKLKVPVQNKNSEYLLIMADAILQNENTGRPNLLRAIYEVMEESHYDEDGNYKTDGIDTVQFESTVKSGLMGRINLNKYVNDANGEAKAKAVMEACLYETTPKTVQEVNPETGESEDVTVNTKTGKYNQTYVHELPFEDYCLQQEVPEHFKNHEQVHGSQLRYIVVSELATKDGFGNDATYEVEGRKVSANEFKAEYEQTVADNIEDSISELESTLGLNSTSTKDRNIALSKILQREILSSPRYGVDLLQACSVDENGRFRIPLGDPIQSKRVEQLINSIIKNRVNKQEIAGGPVVQVTNFGTSRELNIRFKDKNGGLLKTRAEYEKNPIKKELSQTDKFNAKYKGLKVSESTMSYKDYIKENQGGIAYFEVFAPIYANNLFSQFADKNGNISIEALEALDSDLLKMIGYRIPTEAKYSMAPLKIVGFLPREAGDGIMLPSDITLLTGSDFDVDKEYLMR